MNFFGNKIKPITLAAAAVTVLGVTELAEAQHAYLPVLKTGTTDLEILDRDTLLPRTLFTRDYTDFNAHSMAPWEHLKTNGWRATGPSAFPRANDGSEGPFPAGTEGLPGLSRLQVTIPTLSGGPFTGSGKILYWDGTGDPSFGPAPTHANHTVVIQGARGDTGIPDSGAAFIPELAVIDAGPGEVSFEPWNSEGQPEWDDALESRTLTALGTRHFTAPSHSHTWYDLRGDDTAEENAAPAGIYLMGQIVTVFEDDPEGDAALGDVIGTSPISYGIFNRGLDGSLLDSAVSHLVETGVGIGEVPEPAAGVLLALGSSAILLGKRRKA